MENRVIYVGRVTTTGSSTGFFLYTRDIKNPYMFYGFNETEEIQNMNLKKGDTLVIDGPEGGSVSKLASSIQTAFGIEENSAYKWILLIKPSIILIRSLKGSDLDLPPVSVFESNHGKKRLSIYVQTGQKLKEIGRKNGSDKTVLVTDITGHDLEAIVNVRVISATFKKAHTKSDSKMTLRNLFRHYTFVD